MVATLAKLNRRDFLRSGLVFGAGAAGLAAGYAAVPDVFARAVYAAKQEKVTNDKVLVMVQLAGGNDGLQTVIPITDQAYRDLRPQLSKTAEQALPISKDFGLNPNLKGVKSLFDQGKVAIVNGVGYPKPSFSHFDSIRVWETADPDRRQQDGWLGATIAKNYDSAGHPLVGCACGSTEIPGALRDLEATLTVVNSQSAFYQDLAGHGMSDRVLVATWSEFGRRPRENASAGTDHGTAAPVFLIGDTVKPGIYGEQPSLTKLDAGGNMGYAVDFRSVYQEILDTHLEVDAKQVFNQSFDKISVLKTSALAAK